jgi:hypothetical protein
MRVSNSIFILVILLGLSGCRMGEATYEVFEKRMNVNAYSVLMCHPKFIHKKIKKS